MSMTNAYMTPKIIQLYLELSQYPILARSIRKRMREEIFGRGIITQQRFEDEVLDKAIQSQVREGLTDPVLQESPDVWQARKDVIRDSLTDFYFAYNLPHDLFREIVQEIVSQRAPDQEVMLSFNPELAPWDMLFRQAELYESYPPQERAKVQHHLQEILAVLIRTLISDHLAVVGVARKVLTSADLKFIINRRIGRGKIGGKAAGMLLAYKILQREGPARGIDVERLLRIPDSYFLGSDVYYDFKSSNDLFRFMNQKYLTPEDMQRDYPASYEAHVNSRLPGYVHEGLMGILAQVGNAPLIVRSSSLLEDNFDKSFAGKYDSFFLPNQASPEDNLRALEDAIIRIYASVTRPDVLIYRTRMGLIDYDERMAILIQKVEGQAHGNHFFPALAGVAFSHNPYRWNERIQPEAGLLRLVTGLGTRAVDRVGSDYPRMVALSHPTLRPEQGPSMLRYYSQHHIDVIDLAANEFKTLHLAEVLDLDYPALGAVVSIEQEGFLRSLNSRPLSLESNQMVVTFDRLLERGNFVGLMHDVLSILEEAYQHPVDVEFSADLLEVYPQAEARLCLLQCRPLSRSQSAAQARPIPDVQPDRVLFTVKRRVLNGAVDAVGWIVYVDPHTYAGITDPNLRIEIGRLVGRVNQALDGRRFILMGPGRWGSSNIHLGVRVTYADIYNTSVLVEVAYREGGSDPEVSYGTHFFQDLVEANIYPLPLCPDDEGAIFRKDFFLESPNVLADLLPADAALADYLRVIDLTAMGSMLTIIMNADENRAIGYLTPLEANSVK